MLPRFNPPPLFSIIYEQVSSPFKWTLSKAVQFPRLPIVPLTMKVHPVDVIYTQIISFFGLSIYCEFKARFSLK